MSANNSIDIYTTPAGETPPGVISNLKNPFFLHTVDLTTHILCLAVSTIAVAIRIFTNLYIMKQFLAQDCISSLSILLFAAC